MVDCGGTTGRFRKALAEVALVLAASGCAGASPLATASSGASGTSGSSGTPNPSATASSTLHEPPAGAWAPTASLDRARYQHTATLLPNGTVLVAGGLNADGLLSSAETYDPNTGLWTATGSLLEGRASHSATLLGDGTVLVAGGVGNSGYLASAELYDPSKRTWTATESMNGARYDHTATLLGDGTVLVAGGAIGGGDSEVTLDSVELYDPGSGFWATSTNMVRARYRHTATLLLDGTLLVAGGLGGDASAELYDPDSGSWSAIASMTEVRWGHAATLLHDGTVLVTGGCCSVADASAALASAERYDPGLGSWTTSERMDTARYGHVATLLSGGELLIAGGTDFSGSTSGALAFAELYKPGGASWTTAEEMIEARAYPTATLLLDGRVLVVGGYGSGGGALGSAALYNPSGS